MREQFNLVLAVKEIIAPETFASFFFEDSHCVAPRLTVATLQAMKCRVNFLTAIELCVQDVKHGVHFTVIVCSGRPVTLPWLKFVEICECCHV
jgi:hypothetical protein